jgi:hypothetical protein
MTTEAVNSDGINEVSFPGAEQGLSVIELIGTVQVTCALAAVSLLLTVTASSPAAAVSPATGAKWRMTLGASVQAGATVPVVQANTKLRTTIDQPVLATTSAAPVLLARPGAATTGSAAGTVLSYQRAERSASITAAALAVVSERNKTFRGASGVGEAVVTSPVTLNKRRLGAENPAVALASSGLTLARGVGMQTTGLATASAGAWRKLVFAAPTAPAASASSGVTLRVVGTATAAPSAILIADANLKVPRAATASGLATTALPVSVLRVPRGAEATGTASASVEAKRAILLGSSTTAVATTASAGGRLNARVSAAAQALAVPSAITVVNKIAVTFYGQAQATTSTFAADYSTTANAPEERRMVVNFDDRLMRVI